jgi:hypothetical protein
MECVTSRSFKLPESSEEFASSLWFNLWSKRLWPYAEVDIGDTLYWYESPCRTIVWKSRVAEIDRFGYDSKRTLEGKLISEWGPFDTTQPYFVDASEHGYCLVYRVLPLQRLNLSKPEDFKFPQLGWLRVDVGVARMWLSKTVP